MKKPTKIMFGVALVCLLFGGGMYAYLHSKKNTRLNNTATQTQTTTQQPSNNSTEPPAQTAKPTNQFDIPELGIRMTLPEGLEDLVYTIKKSDFDGHLYANFGTKSMSDQDTTDTKCTYAVGTIHRWDKDISSEVVTSKKIGSYYYSFNTSQGACSSKQAVLDMQIDQGKKLRDAFSTVEAL